MALSPEQRAYRRSISTDRLTTYLAAAGGSRDRAHRLYLWDRQLGAAVMADLAFVEVALRNAMHGQLAKRWGAEWYALPKLHLDDRSCKQLSDAWSRVVHAKTPGRVVAQTMFGFWVGLLDKGSFVGREPRRIRCNYQFMWDEALNSAFPGGPVEARASRVSFTRSWTHQVALTVNQVRNRVAHHEPLINGVPLNGQNARLTPQQAYDAYLKLTRLIEPDLESWLRARSEVPGILSSRP